jgi:hypothetical protein
MKTKTQTRITRTLRYLAGLSLLTCFAGAGVAQAETFSITNVQLFTTNDAEADAFNGYGTDDEDLTVFRAEHFGGWEYGDNYISLDLFQGTDVGGSGSGSFGSDTKNHTFFVYQPRLFLPGLKNIGEGESFVRNVYFSYRREQASYVDFYSDNAGLSVDLAVPGTQFFEIDFLARKTNTDDGTKWLTRVVWLAPFSIGRVGAHFDGLVLVKSTDDFGTNVLAQTDLLFDVLNEGQFQAGIRLEHASYDEPDGSDYSRTSPYLMAKLFF